MVGDNGRAALADTVAILDHGRLVAVGGPAELAAARARRTLDFQARTGLNVHVLNQALPATYHAIEHAPGRYTVNGEITPHVVATVTAWCADQRIVIDTFRLDSPSLEDVFLGLTSPRPRLHDGSSA